MIAGRVPRTSGPALPEWSPPVQSRYPMLPDQWNSVAKNAPTLLKKLCFCSFWAATGACCSSAVFLGIRRRQHHRIELQRLVVLQFQGCHSLGEVWRRIVSAEDQRRANRKVDVLICRSGLRRGLRWLGLGRNRWRRCGFRYLRRRNRLRNRASAILLRRGGFAQMSALEENGFIWFHLIRSIAHGLGNHDCGYVPRQCLNTSVPLRSHLNGNVHCARTGQQQPQIRR